MSAQPQRPDFTLLFPGDTYYQLLFPGDTYYQIAHTLRGLLPAPVTDTPVEPPIPNSRTGQERDRALRTAIPTAGCWSPSDWWSKGLRRR